jgi:hypothetical protein
MFNFNTFIMRKFYFLGFLIMFGVVSFAISCGKSEVTNSNSKKEDNDEFKLNEATWVGSSENDSKFWYLKMLVSFGHSAADCGNKCVKILGEQGHADCRGFGNTCTKIVDAYCSVSQWGGGVMLTLVDTTVFGRTLDFDFPDRTLFIINPLNNTDLWLNIPEQLLVRDSTGGTFVIHDIWFSEEPELENK